jgi:tRNA pseudouridine38-40 synthase
MATWQITLEYDGTRYYGWQEQKGSRTVAGELRAAAEGLCSHPIQIAGAGRTDAGVHALGQVVRLQTEARINRMDLLRGLNDRLPPDINILKVENLKVEFDPRHDAVARFYLYQISQRRTAFAKRYVWWVKDRLDHQAMSDAASLLVGRLDFARFCDKRVGDGSTIVVVTDSQFRAVGDLLLFRIGASHFLWKMVRRIVGALVEVGRGSLDKAEFASLLAYSVQSTKAERFDVAAHTAPPSGLFLERVIYHKDQGPGKLVPAFPVLNWSSDLAERRESQTQRRSRRQREKRK